ncbi:MAG: YhcB family protein [Wenzhouxiangellaceae bacterium]
MDVLVWLFAGLIIGTAIGAAAVWLMNKRSSSGESVESIRRENEQFREEVSEHFVETARLINQLTDSYKDVFDHLSQGAEKLADDRMLAERMPKVSRHEVRLHHLGSTESGDSTGDHSKTSELADPLKKPSVASQQSRSHVGQSLTGSKGDDQPADSKPADSKPVDSKPADSKPADKPVDGTQSDRSPSRSEPKTSAQADREANGRASDKIKTSGSKA